MFSSFDDTVTEFIFDLRSPVLTLTMTDLSSLGSVSVVTLFTLVSALLAVSLKRPWAAMQIICAAAGAGLLSSTLKPIVERARPDIATRLVDVTGYSFPSGHALMATAMYLSMALVVGHFFVTRFQSFVIFGLITLVIFIVAISRVYLGVHFATDVLAGTGIGVCWALFLDSCFRRIFASRVTAGHHPK